MLQSIKSHPFFKSCLYAKEKNVYLWQIADELNITDGNFSRKLRRELPEKEQKEVMQIIDRIAGEQVVE